MDESYQTEHYDYDLVAPGMWRVSYLTLDAPPFYMVRVTEEQAAALMGTGKLRFDRDGSPLAIINPIE